MTSGRHRRQASIRQFRWLRPAPSDWRLKSILQKGLPRCDTPDFTGPLAHANSFRAVAEEWLEKARRECRADVTLGRLKLLLDFAHAIIGNRNVGGIKAPELLPVLRAVEQRGHYEMARRLCSTCGEVFRYAIATGRADRNVSAGLRGALIVPKVTHRAAIITPNDAGSYSVRFYQANVANLFSLRQNTQHSGRW